MNYIKRLEEENEEYSHRLGCIHGTIAIFRQHLDSSKFHKDTTIQVSDVHRWLDTIIMSQYEEE